MDTYPINKNFTIDTTSIPISPDREGLNNKRKSIIITNISTGGQIITISIGKESVATEGIVLYPGGSWDRSPNEEPPQFQIQAISSLAGGILSLYEELV